MKEEPTSKKVKMLAESINFSISILGFKETWRMIDEIKDSERRMLLRKIYHKFMDNERKKKGYENDCEY